MFASGTMNPPRWMHNAQHAPDFLQRHQDGGRERLSVLRQLPQEDFCVGCHDGRVRPRNIHPADYLNLHPVEARLATQKCTSCHREQSFCLGCHQRLGVSMSGPTGVRRPGRFHPPKSRWSDAPRRLATTPSRAMRNLNACVSCHIERDCVVCHGGRGIGGGFNPSQRGFQLELRVADAPKSEPCGVSRPGAPVLRRCQ